MGIRYRFREDTEYVVPKVVDETPVIVSDSDVEESAEIPDASGIYAIATEGVYTTDTVEDDKVEDDKVEDDKEEDDKEEDNKEDTTENVEEEPKSSSVPPEELGSEWASFTLSFDMADQLKFLKQVEKGLDAMQSIIDVFVVVLKIIRIISSDLKNISRWIKIALRVIVKQIKELIESLASTGIYSCLINPEFDPKKSSAFVPINGGFSEFQKRVTASMLNSKDPGAPKFDDDAQVGAIVLAAIAGLNDPDILANMLYNINILAKFFNFKAIRPPQPRGLRAAPGFYLRDGVRELGVKLTWDSAGEFISGFRVSRNKGDNRGTYEQLDGPSSRIIQVFDNKDFNGGEPVDVDKGMFRNLVNSKYEYIDFDVEGDTTYFYKLHAYAGNPDKFFEGNPEMRDNSSAVASATVNATPRKRIPLSALNEYLIDERGAVVFPLDLTGEWKSLSIRTILGPGIDKLFDKIDGLADLLDGLIITGSDALGKYIEFFQKKIKKIIDVIKVIEDIIEIILSFSFKGTLAFLHLGIEPGGMKGLAERFNAACDAPPEDDTTMVTHQEDGSDRNGGGFSGSTKNPFTMNESADRGIMMGLVLVWGIPTISEDTLGKDIRPVADSFADIGAGYTVSKEKVLNATEDAKKAVEKAEKAMKIVKALLGHN